MATTYDQTPVSDTGLSFRVPWQTGGRSPIRWLPRCLAGPAAAETGPPARACRARRRRAAPPKGRRPGRSEALTLLATLQAPRPRLVDFISGNRWAVIRTLRSGPRRADVHRLCGEVIGRVFRLAAGGRGPPKGSDVDVPNGACGDAVSFCWGNVGAPGARARAAKLWPQGLGSHALPVAAVGPATTMPRHDRGSGGGGTTGDGKKLKRL